MEIQKTLQLHPRKPVRFAKVTMLLEKVVWDDRVATGKLRP